MKNEIPKTTPEKCHSRCLPLLNYLVKESIYRDDEWIFDDYINHICQCIHEKKHMVYAQLIALQMAGFIIVAVDDESDDYEYIMVTLNMSYINK